MLKLTNQVELMGFLARLAGQHRGTIWTRTPVRMNKKGNPYYLKAFKDAIAVVDIAGVYEEAVNDARLMDGNLTPFQAAERVWGEHKSRALIQNNGDFFLQCHLVQEKDLTYFLDDGTTIDYERLAPFVVESKSSSPVAVRTFKLENIKGLTLGKMEYIGG